MDILQDFRVVELRKNTEHIGHCDTNLFKHLAGTYKILKDANRPDYLCLAGLFHSVYETEYVTFNTPYSRDYVEQLIGKQAEHLVYEFCKLSPRINKLLDRDGDWDNQVYADLLEIELANMVEQRYYNDSIKMLEAIRSHLKVY